MNNTFEQASLLARDVDEQFFLEATREFDDGDVKEATWAKAVALAEGDVSKAKYRYIQMRAAQMEKQKIDQKHVGDQQAGARVALPTPSPSPTKIATTPEPNPPAAPQAPAVQPERAEPEYITLEEFLQVKSIPRADVIKMLRDGFFSGYERDGQWYVHVRELAGAPLPKRSAGDVPKDGFISASEFAQRAGLEESMVVQRVREGFYDGKSVDGAWVVSAKALADAAAVNKNTESFLSRLVSGGFGLAQTYWLFGVLAQLLLTSILSEMFNAGQMEVAIFFLVLVWCYGAVMVVATWNACNRYTGPKIWPILVKIQLSLGVAGAIIGAVILLGGGL